MYPTIKTKKDYAARNKGGGELVSIDNIDDALEAYYRNDDVFIRLHTVIETDSSNTIFVVTLKQWEPLPQETQNDQ